MRMREKIVDKLYQTRIEAEPSCGVSNTDLVGRQVGDSIRAKALWVVGCGGKQGMQNCQTQQAGELQRVIQGSD